MLKKIGSVWSVSAILLLVLSAAPAWGQAKNAIIVSDEQPSELAGVPAGGFQVGQEYEAISGPVVLYEPDDGRIEVLSYFWYNCGACYAIDPEMHEWASKLPADVRFIRLPATFYVFHARIYFTLRAMDLGFEADQTVFNLFRNERKPVNQPEQLADLARVLKVDKKILIETFHSPAVDAMVAKAEKSMDDYGLLGVPAMVVDGRYRFDISTAHGPEGYKKLAEYLIEKRRQERQKNKGSKPAKK
jgi:Predicted dithiol-disulfide isomerase involved in polyketide biosynthesis